MCVINSKFIISLILLGFSQYTKSAWLRCYDGLLDSYVSTTLDNPTPLLKSSCYNPSLRTLVYTFGYRGKRNGPATTAVLTTYLATKKRNIILLDWEEEAKSGSFGIQLGYVLSAVPNAKKVGEKLGDALTQLAHSGLNMSDVQLMGHSLGAHLMGYAGRRSRKNGQVVSRITGLDPARALFEGSLAVFDGLDRSCAKFVDIIHSNPGYYGTSKPSGTVDLWPNFDFTGLQPGCPTGKYDMFTPEDLCSHDRSWRYLVESVKSATAFQASAADNYDSWVVNKGASENIIYLGDLTNTKARGNFYFMTHSRAPYGMGLEGVRPGEHQVRGRRQSDDSLLTKFIKFFR